MFYFYPDDEYAESLVPEDFMYYIGHSAKYEDNQIVINLANLSAMPTGCKLYIGLDAAKQFQNWLIHTIYEATVPEEERIDFDKMEICKLPKELL